MRLNKSGVWEEETITLPEGYEIVWDTDQQLANVYGDWYETPIVCTHEWVDTGFPGGMRFCKKCDEDFKGEWDD